MQRYIVDELEFKSSNVEYVLRWNYDRRSTEMLLIVIACVFGLVMICASSFILFYRHSENFIAITTSGNAAGPHLNAVLSIILPTLGLLLEVFVNTWIWYDYRTVIFPALSFSSGLVSVFLAFSLVSLVCLAGCCGLNMIRAKYAAELVDLHFAVEGNQKNIYKIIW